jgi:hypothetical protein
LVSCDKMEIPVLGQIPWVVSRRKSSTAPPCTRGSRRKFYCTILSNTTLKLRSRDDTSHLVSSEVVDAARLILLKFQSLHQFIRYGLVARICRSHQSSSLPSAGKARVRFPVSETVFLPLESFLWCGVVVVVQSGIDFC